MSLELVQSAEKLLEKTCRSRNPEDINMAIYALLRFKPWNLGDYIRLLEKNRNLDQWLERRLKQSLELSVEQQGDTHKAEEWAYKFGYFQRRLSRSERDRKYLRYIYLCGNWMVEEKDLPRVYLAALFRILMRLFRDSSGSVKKEIIRLTGKVLRSPPRHMSPSLHRLLHKRLIRTLENETSWELRIFASAALLHSDNRLVLGFLEEQLLDTSQEIELDTFFELISLMRGIKSPSITSILLKMYRIYVVPSIAAGGTSEDSLDITKRNLWICQALAWHNSDLPYPSLVLYLKSPRIEEAEKVRTITAIIKIHQKIHLGDVKALVDASTPWLRSLGALLIAYRRRVAEIAWLERLVEDPVPIVREYALRAINHIRFYGTITLLGEVRGGRIDTYMSKEEANPILQRQYLIGHLFDLQKEDYPALIKHAVKYRDLAALGGVLEYLKDFARPEEMSYFSYLLDAEPYIAMTYCCILLEHCTELPPALIERMLGHKHFNIRLVTAAWLLEDPDVRSEAEVQTAENQ